MDLYSRFAKKVIQQTDAQSKIIYKRNFSQITSPLALMVFFISLVSFLGFIYLLIIGSDSFGLYVLLILLSIPGLFLGFVRRYGPTQKAVIYRFGSFARVVGPGWSFVLPFIEKEFAVVDMRVHHITKQGVVAYTKDDVPIEFDFVCYFRITDPAKAVMKLSDIKKTISTYIYGNMREVVGNVLMREIFSNMSVLEGFLKPKLEEHSVGWGFNIENVEILRATLPKTVFQALSEPITQEQKSIAARFQAEAKRVMINVIGDAAKNLSTQTLTYLYIQALNKLGKQPSSKIVIPTNYSSMANLATNATLASQALGGKAKVNEIVKKAAENIKKGSLN